MQQNEWTDLFLKWAEGGGGWGCGHYSPRGGGGGDVPKRYLTNSYCMLWLSSLLLSQVDFLATSVTVDFLVNSVTGGFPSNSVTGVFPGYVCHRWISQLLLSQLDFLVNSFAGGFPGFLCHRLIY